MVGLHLRPIHWVRRRVGVNGLMVVRDLYMAPMMVNRTRPGRRRRNQPKGQNESGSRLKKTQRGDSQTPPRPPPDYQPIPPALVDIWVPPAGPETPPVTYPVWQT